jgi:ATP-dependent DNA ligase
MPAQEHKRRSEVQLCYPFSEDRLFNRGRLRSNWTAPYIYQNKLNGERCRTLVESTRVLMFSSTGEIITTLPHLTQQLRSFLPGEYDGELYVHGWSFSEIHSAVSTTMEIHPRANEVEYHLFDCITNPSEPQVDRVYRLRDCLQQAGPTESIKQVFSLATFTLDDIMHHYDQSIADGYEGFVLKELSAPYIKRESAYRSPYWMKFKPKQTDTYTIVGVNEAISKEGKPLQMIGSFNLIDPEGNKFSCGAGKLTHKNRKSYWNSPSTVGSTLLIEYQTKSDKLGVPHFARAVKILSNNPS